jgi:ankyrin repeat protein
MDHVEKIVVTGHHQAVTMLLWNHFFVGHPQTIFSMVYTTALHEAVKLNDIETVELLLEHGIDITAIDWRGSTALHCARNNTAMLRKLIEKRPDQINSVVDSNRKTILISVTVEKNYAAVKFLLSKNADLSACDLYGETALHYAAERGYLAIVEALVDAGSELAMLDTGGRTPLRCAQLKQHHAVVALLASKTVVPKGVLGWTELHYASWTGHWMMVIQYVTNGWSVSAQDRNGATPLHLAARKGHLVVVKYLLAAGANRQALDKGERTPLDYARRDSKDAVVEYLSGAHNGREVHDKEQRTAWDHIVILQGDEEHEE